MTVENHRQFFKVENGAVHLLDVFFSYVSHVFDWVFNPPLRFFGDPALVSAMFLLVKIHPKKNKTSGSESAMPACVGLPGNCCGGGAWLVRICFPTNIWVCLMIYLSILMILYDVFVL